MSAQRRRNVEFTLCEMPSSCGTRSKNRPTGRKVTRFTKS
jgi:hypothetical protein